MLLIFQTMMVLCQEQGEVSMTYRECQDQSMQIARYFLQQGYKKVGKYHDSDGNTLNIYHPLHG